MKHTSCPASIDSFRGFAVMLLVLSSHHVTVDAPFLWLRHAPDGRLTFPDLGVPWFIFTTNLKFLIMSGGTT